MGKISTSWNPVEINYNDLQLLSSHCERTVLAFLPFGSKASFLSPTQISEDSEWFTHVHSINEVRAKGSPTYSKDGRVLFLSLYTDEKKLLAICAIEILDYSFLKNISSEWLLDRCRIISRECSLLNKLYFDPLTGFLNGIFFRDTLEHIYCQIDEKKGGSFQTDNALSVVLLEVYSKGADHETVLNYINRAGHLLLSCSSENDVFSYLGNGVFGFLWSGLNEKQSHQKVRNLLNLLKREGYSKVHLGIVHSELSVEQERTTDCILDNAWQVLSAAHRRGPYSFSFYESEQISKNHPLKGASLVVQKKMRSLWRGLDSFSVALMHSDHETEKLDMEEIQTCLGKGVDVLPDNAQELYLFFPGVTAEGAKQKLKKVKKKLSKSLNHTYSLGISAFPHHLFTKSETLLNARKALLHTYFYGTDTVTVFDGLSLNVSGDIYYEEGDMLNAVREYRKGISIEPGNINLLNSLGETYAQMNRHRQANHFFSEVLALDPYHFMALYNSGVASVMLGEEERAIQFFEEGMRVGLNKNPQGADRSKNGFKNEHPGLLFQLGRLYCKRELYDDAIPLLERSVAIVDAEFESGSNCLIRRVLAEAYTGVGKNREAISLLQSVLNSNPYDSDAMSMLGELYSLEGQGDDIALSLCLNAIEINGSRSDFLCRVAKIYYKLNKLHDAEDAIKKSLKFARKDVEALFLAGQILMRLGRKVDAARKFTSVLRLDSLHKKAKKALKGCG